MKLKSWRWPRLGLSANGTQKLSAAGSQPALRPAISTVPVAPLKDPVPATTWPRVQPICASEIQPEILGPVRAVPST
jgi:hypothetical protein